MENMTGPADEPRRVPAPPYRAPVAAGQTYPALGFDADGTPRFGYAPPTAAAAPPADPEPPSAPVGPPPPPERRPGPRAAYAVLGVLVLLLVVVAALKVTSRDAEEPVARTEPPVSQPLDDPYLDDQAPQHEDEPDTPPGSRVPESSAPSGPGQDNRGQQVRYVVTSDGPASIAYTLGDRPMVALLSRGSWSRTFTGTGDVPALVADVMDGHSASCEIRIGTQVVAENQLSAESPNRTLTCKG